MFVYYFIKDERNITALIKYIMTTNMILTRENGKKIAFNKKFN